MTDKTSLPPPDRPPPIFRIRGVEVVLDSDPAAALGMATKRLNEQIKMLDYFAAGDTVETVVIEDDEPAFLPAHRREDD